MDLPSVKKNYIYRLSYEILAVITPFITTPYVSRVLGADGIGIYSYTSSLMTYFTLFATLGTESYGAREISQHRDSPQEVSRLFFEIELIIMATSGICLAAWGLVIAFSDAYRWYFIALIPTLLGTMFNLSWFFTGLEQVKYIVVRNTLCKLLGIVLLFLLVRRKEDLILYMLINSGVHLLGSLSMWTYLPRMIRKVDPRTLRFGHHFRETLIYFIPTIATSVYTVLDKTLIGLITRDTYENGYYEQATKIINILKSFAFTAVNAVMDARISYLFMQDKLEEIKKRIRRSIDFIYLISFGCVFGVIAVADTFVPMFFGPGFEPVVLLLRVMAPIILIIGTSNCLGCQYYTPGGLRAQSARYIVTGSVVNLILNLMLIPSFGALGATAASILAESCITVLYVAKCSGFLTVRTLWHCARKRIAAGVGMLLAVMALPALLSAEPVVVVILQVLLGVFLYFGILLLLHDTMLLELIRMVLGWLHPGKKEKKENG